MVQTTRDDSMTHNCRRALKLSFPWNFQIRAVVSIDATYIAVSRRKVNSVAGYRRLAGQDVPLHSSLCSLPLIELVSISQKTLEGPSSHGPVP